MAVINRYSVVYVVFGLQNFLNAKLKCVSLCKKIIYDYLRIVEFFRQWDSVILMISHVTLSLSILSKSWLFFPILKCLSYVASSIIHLYYCSLSNINIIYIYLYIILVACWAADQDVDRSSLHRWNLSLKKIIIFAQAILGPL